jgi:4-hydroxybenzoate polyprenyltransferase
MLHLPKQGYFRRMWTYLAEMFPILPRLASSALLYISFVYFLERIHKMKGSIYSPYTFVGIWSIFALMLILRLMDELKDMEIDIELFRDRPLPSGKVLELDIRFSLVVVIVFYLAANIFIGHAFWMAVFVLGYSLMMFKYFFMPWILRRYLLLNLLTHNPIVPMILIYLLILFSFEHKLPLKNLNWHSSLLLIGMYWAMFFAWEIARKIRSREEENAYVTYSQIFGPFGAVLIAVGTQTIAFIIGFYFFWALSLSGIFLAILLAGYGMTIWGHTRFVIHPNPATSRLKPFAERFILSILVAQIISRLFAR